MRPIVPALASLVVLAGCASQTGPHADAAPPPPPKGTVASNDNVPQQCVELTRIRESKVIDDRTIDFVLRDGRVLRNTLPYACPQLGFERAFTYSTSLSKLCSVDIITVIIQGGGPQLGASCGLGKFMPYTPVPK